MEDALRVSLNGGHDVIDVVLILVVMEDALRVVEGGISFDNGEVLS